MREKLERKSRGRRDSHHGDEQHQDGRGDFRQVDDALTGVPRIDALEQYPRHLLDRAEPREHLGIPLHGAEQDKLDPDETEDGRHQELRMELRQQVEVPGFRGIL